MKLSFILIFIFLTTACTHLYKFYDYKNEFVITPNSKVEIQLVGSWKKVSDNPEITERRNPYMVVVRVFTDEVGVPVEIKLNKVAQKDLGEILINKASDGITKKSVENWSPFTAGVFSNIYISEHGPVEITGSVQLHGENTEFNVVLLPKYHQQKRNNTYDGIMSI